MCSCKQDEESNTSRSWWLLLGLVITAAISGFLLARPYESGETNMYYVLLTGVLNIVMVCVIGMAFWRFYTTVPEERFVVTRKYVIVVLLVLVVKYIYMRSIQTASLTKCAPNIREDCRKTMEEDGYSAFQIVMVDLFVFLVIGAIGVFLIQYLLEPIERDGFNAWMSRYVKPRDNEDKLYDGETKSKDIKTTDNDTTFAEKV